MYSLEKDNIINSRQSVNNVNDNHSLKLFK